MANIHFHPNHDLLSRYANGELDSASSILISAHLEFCPHCRQKIAAIEAKQARILESSESATLTPSLSAMMLEIMAHEPAETIIEEVTDCELTMEDKTYPLPSVLQRHNDKIGPWSRLPGNIKRAQVEVSGDSKMNFIYMDSDSSLPEHTHQGQEITLVLAGEFYDESGTYKPGDFIVQTDEHTHLPRTREGQDCLCLTLLNAPLHFTSGLATLLNPFSQLFFRR
ncbi:ChrR family anti-sigma-E factor [Photobacterium rosenbergii]|uniref:ChrR family anti-sigma-E factor n=1 Tax=Photobacterium rosenbergii TaxID=294936 RepID=A0ABU3ZIJ0_9GAMM|nr:ChrR family anti-sigma-E factor [Photobacterium rosenbergii]MDV5169827.1 ChrR family anti-sigma-E factor [Photobacterium rosenbergii]